MRLSTFGSTGDTRAIGWMDLEKTPSGAHAIQILTPQRVRVLCVLLNSALSLGLVSFAQRFGGHRVGKAGNPLRFANSRAVLLRRRAGSGSPSAAL